MRLTRSDHLMPKPEGGGYESHPGKRRHCAICYEASPKGCELVMIALFFAIIVLVSFWAIVSIRNGAG